MNFKGILHLQAASAVARTELWSQSAEDIHILSGSAQRKMLIIWDGLREVVWVNAIQLADFTWSWTVLHKRMQCYLYGQLTMIITLQHSCTEIFGEFLVFEDSLRKSLYSTGHDYYYCSPRMCIGTWLFCHWCGLVAGKNCWHRLDRSVFRTTLFLRSGLRRWRGSSCWVTWTPCAYTWDDGIRSRISWARAELAEDISPSFVQQGGRTINNHSSRSGGGSGWRACLLINSKLTWYLTSQCHYPCGYAESRQTDLEVKNLHSNHANVV